MLRRRSFDILLIKLRVRNLPTNLFWKLFSSFLIYAYRRNSKLGSQLQMYCSYTWKYDILFLDFKLIELSSINCNEKYVFLPGNQDNFHGPYDHRDIYNYEYAVLFHNPIPVRTYRICCHILNHSLLGDGGGACILDDGILEWFDETHGDAVAVDDGNLCAQTLFVPCYH